MVLPHYLLYQWNENPECKFDRSGEGHEEGFGVRNNTESWRRV